MKEYLSYCARCNKECHSLELTKGLCQNCVNRLKFSIDPADARAKDTTVEVIEKRCVYCESIWKFVRGNEKENCPTCGISYAATVINLDEKTSKALPDATQRRIIDNLIAEIAAEVVSLNSKLERKQLELKTLKTMRSLLK